MISFNIIEGARNGGPGASTFRIGAWARELQSKSFRFGEWQVDRAACTLVRDGDAVALAVEPRAMDVLTALCGRSGEILSAGDLLRLCWDGLNVGENQVHKAIAQLRRAFGDSANEPRYIENIRKRGYRTLAPVSWDEDEPFEAVPENWSQGSPYVGLDPFDADRASLFCGRNAAVARLVETVAAQIARGRALVLVLGPSGSGKTSLVQAGLIPALRRPAAEVMLDLGDIGQTPPATALGSALLDWEIDGQPVLAGRNAEEIGDGLASGRALELSVLHQAATTQQDGRFLLFIDRLEALFDGGSVDEAQKSRFLAALDRLARSGAALIILACRNDFYPSIAKEPLLMEGKASGGHFDVEPPTRGEIWQMISLPAQAAGLTFGTDPGTKDSLADLLCDAAANSPDALPLLQYTLQELYFQRSPTRELTIAAYRSLGGIAGAIGKRAEAAMSSLPDSVQAALFRILPLIVQIDADDGLVRSRRAPWSALESIEDRAMVRALVDQRLFVTLGGESASLFGVAHEALLRQWPRVVDWIAEHRQALRTRSRLETSAQRWLAEGRRRDLLLPRGKQLEEAKELANRPQFYLGADIRMLIAASGQRVRQGDYFRLGTVAAFAVIAVVAGTMGVIAQRAEGVAERRSREAEGLMSYMVGDLADKLRPLGRLELLSGVSEKALSYFSDSRIDKLTPAERRNQAKALQTLAEVARAHADPKAARDALMLARSLLNHEPESFDLLKDLGANAFWLGQIALDQKRLDDAESAFEDYRHFAERMMVLEPDNVDAWIESSYAYTNVGSLANTRGDHGTAQVAFEKSIVLKRRALERHPDDRTLRGGLALGLSWLGSALEAAGNLPQALALYDQEQVELQALRAAAPSESTWTFRLVGTKRRRADVLTDLGDDKLAEEEYRAAQTLAQALTQQDPSNRLWQRALLNSQSGEGKALTALGKLSEALALQLANAEKFAELTEQDLSNREWKMLETTNLLRLGDTLIRLGRPAEAVQPLELVFKKLQASPPGIAVDIDQRMAHSYILLAQANRAVGGKTDEECRKAKKILDPLHAADPTNDYTQDLWVRAHLCLGQRDQAQETITWLARIGYRRFDYLQFLSQTP